MVEVEKPISTPIPPQPKVLKAVAQVADKGNERKSNKRILQGQVVSNKPDKTIILKVVRQVAHPIYKKYYKKTNKFMAHDANNECSIGDIVRVKECRPLSSRKTWELIEIVQRAK